MPLLWDLRQFQGFSDFNTFAPVLHFLFLPVVCKPLTQIAYFLGTVVQRAKHHLLNILTYNFLIMEDDYI